MPSGPTYQAHRQRYEIDSCRTQERAVQDGKIEFHALTKGHYPGTLLPGNILPGLNSIGFWNAGGAQDWGLEPHRNEGIEIMFLETGSMMFSADRKEYALRAGHFTITRPWQLHQLGSPNIGPGRLHWLILDVGVRRPHQNWQWPTWVVLTKNDLKELTRKLRHHENPVCAASPEIVQSFRELARSIKNWQAPHAVSRLVVNLNQLLIGILATLSKQAMRADVQLVSHRHTLEIFLHDLGQGRVNLGEPWTLDRMARHCGMGKTAFSKYCREITNASPVEFLNRCRLDRAAQMLLERPVSSITEVAFALGFNSSQYFAACFRQRFHTSPRSYALKKSEPQAAN